MIIKIEKLIPKGFGYSVFFDGDAIYVNPFKHMSIQLDKCEGV